MKSISHRERVLNTFNHIESDRVPKDLMGNATMILDDTYIRLRDYLGLSPIDPIRKGSSANYYDERILDYFDIDFRRIFLKANTEYNTIVKNDDGTFTDVWSVQYRKDGLFITAIDHPLADIQTIKEIENYPWPRADKMFDLKGLEEKARELYYRTDYAVVARNPLTAGFIDRACQLMGTENFLISLISRPKIVKCILEHIFQIYSSVYSFFLEEVGEYIQMVETADDIGTQDSLLLSPEHYREFIKPLEKKFYQFIHEKAPNAAVFRHTDGSVFSLIPDFIELGINVLNPVQTSSHGMDGERLKNFFGDEITFHGAIESLNEPLYKIEQEVKEKMAIFKNRGGYIFAPCNHIINTRPENIIGLFEAAERYGSY
ncbi:MAG: hypothetical protein FVQ80_13535 [Planctomycetes bacterium]|nr:hypothetical protein [Planctomycetota bacterium]